MKSAALCCLVVFACAMARADDAAREAEAARLLATGKWAEAVAAYDGILQARPGDTAAQLRRAVALQEMGDASAAASALEGLARSRPVPQVFYRLARAQARLQQTAGALQNLHRAIALGFPNTNAIEREPDFAALRGDPRFEAEVAYARTAAHPGRSLPGFRALDFLQGEWEQQTKEGRGVGTSRVSVINDGCALLQVDTNPPDYTAHSIYSINPADGKWQQAYFDSRAVVYHYDITLETGGIVTRLRAGSDAPMLYRNTLTQIDSGRLRFLIEGSLDEGATWFNYFDGFWVKTQGPGK